MAVWRAPAHRQFHFPDEATICASRGGRFPAGMTGTMPHLPSPAGAPLYRMNGLGNRIVVLDLRGRVAAVTAGLARRIGAAPGLLFDQLMTIHDPRRDGAAAWVSIHNIDGSEAGACGNGMRCVAHVMLSREIAGEAARAATVVETVAGMLECRHEHGLVYTVDMGAPRLTAAEIPLSVAVADTVHVAIDTAALGAGLPPDFAGVSIGNPHAIFFVDDVEAHELARTGPVLEHHALFPERANISLAHVTAPDALTLKVWERGAGLTLACGSGACAAAVAAHRRGLTGRKVTVTLPGGDLMIHWRADGRVMMTGPVEMEHRTALPAEWLKDAA
jgi:diaminopimelate epimerase